MRNEVYMLISDKISAYISKLNIKKLLILIHLFYQYR